MKTLYTAIIICLSFFSQAQTSVYHPFPDSSASWNFKSFNICNGSGTTNRTFSYFMKRDTVISGIAYHQLWISDMISETNGICFPSTGQVIYPSHYICGIRQDISAKKVYIINGQTENLLYDFTMQVGDTVKGSLQVSFQPNHTDTVISIDSVLIGTEFHKRWFVDDCYTIYITEGIGSNYGLISELPQCYVDLDSYYDQCFRQNGNVLYPQGISICDLVSGLNTISKPVVHILISPNPSDGNFKINAGDQIIKQIMLTDLYGKNILTKENIDNKEFLIDNLSSGTYLLSTTLKNGTVILNKLISYN